MDGIANSGFDGDCLNNVATASKDYIAIPFAEVPTEDPHSVFCDTSLDGKSLSCTILLNTKMVD